MDDITPEDLFDDLSFSVNLALMVVLVVKLKRLLQKRARIRRLHPLGRRWTKEHNTQTNRRRISWYHTLLKSAAKNDHQVFFNWTRMSPTAFNDLANRLSVSGLVNKKLTNMREPISVGERLAITLRYYATGDNLTTIAAGYCIGHSTACEIVVTTGKAIYEVLAPEFLKVPDTAGWKKIANDFGKMWQFPNCVGANDGKHIGMQAPANSGSDFFNYKLFHSIILMAMCDSKYRFTFIDVGAYGRQGDKNVYNSSRISQLLETGGLGLPPCSKLPYSDKYLPHVIVGDDSFPLKPYMLKPFPGRCSGTMPGDERIFNYRLSRARRVIENAFGILAGRWRIFRKPIIAKPENVEHFTKACVVLHNYLISTDQQYIERGYADQYREDGSLIEGGWRRAGGNCFTDLPPRSGMNFSVGAKNVRDSFKNYFNSDEGSVPWQFDLANFDGREEY